MKALTKTVAEKEAESAAVQIGQSLWNGAPEEDEDDE